MKGYSLARIGGLFGEVQPDRHVILDVDDAVAVEVAFCRFIPVYTGNTAVLA